MVKIYVPGFNYIWISQEKQNYFNFDFSTVIFSSLDINTATDEFNEF